LHSYNTKRVENPPLSFSKWEIQMFKFRNRVLALIMVLALVLGVVANVAAQEDTFGLTAEELAAWGEANAASTAGDNLEFTYFFDVSITAEGDSFAGSISGEGAFSGESFSMTVVGDIDEVGAVDLELRFVDERLYVTGFDESGAWLSVSESDFEGLTEMAGDQIPFDIDALASGDTSELGLDEAQQQEALFAIISLSETIADYVAVETFEEEGSDGYFAEFFLDDFVQDPAVQTLIGIGVSSQNPEATDTELQEANAAAVLIAAGSELSFTQYIDPETSLVEEGIFVLALGGESMPFEVYLELDAIIDSYESSAEIVAPEEALPLGMLLGIAGE
jgi:hypothetical protein